MRVWVYPEKTHEELGAKRYDVQWQELPGNWKPNSDEESEAVFDRLVTRHLPCATLGEARRLARKVWNDGRSFFGVVEIQEQVVDWYVEEDRVASWEDVGTPEEIS